MNLLALIYEVLANPIHFKHVQLIYKLNELEKLDESIKSEIDGLVQPVEIDKPAKLV